MAVTFCCERCGCPTCAYTVVYSGDAEHRVCVRCRPQVNKFGMAISESELRQKKASAYLASCWYGNLADKVKALIKHDRILRGEG